MRTSLLKDTTTHPHPMSSASSDSSAMYMKDWRTALRSPPTYRIGNRTVRVNSHFALFIFGLGALFVLFMYVLSSGQNASSDVSGWISRRASSSIRERYNSTYPLSTPILLRGMQTYKIGLIADMDTNSKVTNGDGSVVWRSYLKTGYLSYTAKKNSVKVIWDETEPIALDSSFALKGRGMELSELVTFNGKLLTFDDRTGLIYELTGNKVFPWVILSDGDGHSTKGFKSEWATVKDKLLYVGSMGKEWTTSSGEFENENPMFIKIVSPSGEVTNVDWSFNYKILREDALRISWPGYMIHESAMWSDVQRKWYFLPRRCSKEKYNETRDEQMGCNVLITADERFTKISTVAVSNPKPTHGFSSFKFIPGTDDRIIVAIKSEEFNGKTATFITAFTVDGQMLLEEEQVPTDLKYEGIEFI